MTDVACFAAMTAAVPAVTMTSTLSRTNSAAISAKRSLRPSAQRYSIATVRPSIQPSSRSRCTKAAIHWLWAEGVLAPRNPMVGSFARLLRARRERPRRRRAAEQRDELAPLHSITSSARASSDGGMVEAERLGGLEVDDQLELGRLHHRQVGGLFALENPADVDAGLAISSGMIGSVAHQAAGIGEFAP